jgi:hypothetical protein
MSIWENIIDLNPPIDSVVDFPTPTRFHMAVNVKEVEALIPFYRSLFGNEPTVRRDGYAKFELVNPPLNISLNRVVHNAAGHGRFGMRLSDENQLNELSRRLESTGLSVTREAGPDGSAQIIVEDLEANRWKFFATEESVSVVTKAPEPVVTKAPEPVVTKAPEPVVTKAPEIDTSKSTPASGPKKGKKRKSA